MIVTLADVLDVVEAPNLVGLTLADAQAVLDEFGIDMTWIGEGVRIVSQSVVPGEEITEGDTIIVTVESDTITVAQPTQPVDAEPVTASAPAATDG